jgi:hypothetical protein
MNEHPFPPDARSAASAAADAIRALNHLTAPHLDYPGLRDTDDLYATLGELTTLAQRLDQTVAQLARWAADAARDGCISSVSSAAAPRQSTATTVALTRDNLRHAATGIRQAATGLNAAWSLSGYLAMDMGEHPEAGTPTFPRQAGFELGDGM